MTSKPEITLEELRTALAGGDESPRGRARGGLPVERIHDHAIAALHGMRGLSKADKRRVLRRAEKLLDA